MSEETNRAEELRLGISKKLHEIFKGKTIYIKEIEEDINQYAQEQVKEALENPKYEYMTIKTDGHYIQNCKHSKELIKDNWELVTTSITFDNFQRATFKRVKK